ncbi:MAG: hypothetical protein DYG89_28000 [Caldilinea sp. CFX5]|nr:hypothetical protein [Caldilinea sp. CFX5]
MLAWYLRPCQQRVSRNIDTDGRQTNKAWAGTCRQLIVRLVDGTDHSALFQFNGKVRSADAESETEVVQQIFLPLVNR